MLPIIILNSPSHEFILSEIWALQIFNIPYTQWKAVLIMLHCAHMGVMMNSARCRKLITPSNRQAGSVNNSSENDSFGCIFKRVSPRKWVFVLRPRIVTNRQVFGSLSQKVHNFPSTWLSKQVISTHKNVCLTTKMLYRSRFLLWNVPQFVFYSIKNAQWKIKKVNKQLITKKCKQIADNQNNHLIFKQNFSLFVMKKG